MASYFCSTCDKAFQRKGDLTRHGLLHTGVKPYKCEDCGRAFSQNSGLKTHRNVHSRDKPFKCGLGNCKSAFGDPSSCARHRKETHRGAGTYRCVYPGCSSSIKRRSAYTAHLKKHGIDPTTVNIDATTSRPRRLRNSHVLSAYARRLLDSAPERFSTTPESHGHPLSPAGGPSPAVFDQIHSSHNHHHQTTLIPPAATVHIDQTNSAAPYDDFRETYYTHEQYDDTATRSPFMMPFSLQLPVFPAPHELSPSLLFAAEPSFPPFESPFLTSSWDVPNSQYTGVSACGNPHETLPMLFESPYQLSPSLSASTPPSRSSSSTPQIFLGDLYEQPVWGTYPRDGILSNLGQERITV